MEQITIKDIARLLNVSPSTVSRALKGNPEIGEETRQKVQEMAKRLNYQPNKAALSLLQARTRTIGVIVPNLGYNFFAQALQGIEEEASARGYTMIASQSMESEEKEIRNVNDMKRSGVDGVLISLAQHSRQTNHLLDLQTHMPMVMFDRVSDEIRCSKIFVNNIAGAFSAVEHLIKTGCRRIAYIAGPKELLISSRRKDGYNMALYRHKRKVEDGLIVHCEFTAKSAERAAMRLLKGKDRPDGIFAVSDRVAIGVMEAARKLSIAIPDELAIVGFNDEPVSAMIHPGLSSVRQPVLEMGRMAARLLIDQIESTGPFKPVIKSYMTRLIVRESSRRK
ncbi:MAG: LacI family DNA-binding transcriptional regulator [Chitinophagaceae bacterium]|jgi:LacI family transcriptional regulator